ncbi:lysostaphin resistance A-like protein [Bacillaceae bacterium W0354]
MPKRYWLIILTYVLVAQLSVIIGAPIILAFFPHLTVDEAGIHWLIISNFIAVIMILKLLQPDMKETSMRSGPTFGTIIKWSLLGFFLAIFSQVIANYITIEYIGVDEPSENTASIMEMVEVNTFLVIVIVLFAPILEEIIFRKIIFGELHKRMNFFIAAILSALTFAVLHWDFNFILSYIAMGLVFAFLYVKTKRIIVPIIVHAMMNGYVVVVQLFVDIEELERKLQQYENALAIFFGG